MDDQYGTPPEGAAPASGGLRASPIGEVVEDRGVVSVSLAGSFCGDSVTKALREVVHDLGARGISRIVLDLKEIQRIDSAGLGAIASAYVSVTRASGKFVLASATGRVRDLLSTAMLLQVIPLYPDVRSARAALEP